MSNKLEQLDRAIDLAINQPKQDLESILKSVLIDPTEEIKALPVAWQQVNRETQDSSILGTLGNFSAFIGKPKSKKTFLTSFAVSVALNNGTLFEGFQCCLPEDKLNVLYFDTEQGKPHVQRVTQRICRQTNEPEPKNLMVYHLRKFNAKERVELIEHAIYNTPNIGFVIIDGLKDLVSSINDEDQANDIISKLMKWTEEKHIHLITVLHQNKGDLNARGHLGTELVNKAETVLSVTKSEHDENTSIVEPLQCRNREPEPFAFEVIDGLPQIIPNYEVKAKKSKGKFDILGMEDFKKFKILTEVFSNGSEFGYSHLVSQIKVALNSQFRINIGNNKIKDLVTQCKLKGWLIQEAEKKPYKLGEYESNPDNPF